MVVVPLVLPVAWGLVALSDRSSTSPSDQIFLSYHLIMIVLQSALCVVIYHSLSYHQEVVLGCNLKGILTGTCLMVMLQAINFSARLFEDGPLTVFAFCAQFIYYAALIVFAHTLWDYQPMKRLTLVEQERISELNQKLQQVLKSVFPSR